MTLTSLEIQKGKVLMRREEAAQYLGVSPITIDRRLGEMSKEMGGNGRYSERVVTKVGGIKIINVLALLDYIHYKERLDIPNLRKYVPPFDPKAWAIELGIYTEREAI